MYQDTTLQPLNFVSLVTEHKLIGAIIALAVLVFVVSIVKIISTVRKSRKEARRQD